MTTLTKTNTLYEVHYAKDGSDRVILVVDDGEGFSCKSFGFVSVFDVARILREYANEEFSIKRSTVGKFKKLFGKACEYSGVEL